MESHASSAACIHEKRPRHKAKTLGQEQILSKGTSTLPLTVIRRRRSVVRPWMLPKVISLRSDILNRAAFTWNNLACPVINLG